jgi:hypothetical protein
MQLGVYSFNQAVPRSYRFVNDMDAVPKLPPKLVIAFEHVGKEVILDTAGHYIFGPSYVEQSFYGSGRSATLTDHKIRAYVRALDCIYRWV